MIQFGTVNAAKILGNSQKNLLICVRAAMTIREFCKKKLDWLCWVIIAESVIILGMLGYWIYNHLLTTPVGAGSY
jgi:hypothetical protein